MKNLLCILLLIGVMAASCNPPAPAKTSNKKTLVTRVDYNVETLGIIFALSGDADWLLEHSNKSGDSYFLQLYRKEFGKFKAHPAVVELDSLSAHHILAISNPYIGLHYSPLPEFRQRYAFDEEFYKQSGLPKSEVDSSMQKFAELVRQFYKDASLAAFFDQHKMVYDEVVKEVNASLPKNDFTTTLRQFYGRKDTAELTIVPSPAMFAQWGFGYSIKTDSANYFFQLLSHGEERDIKSWSDIKPGEDLGFGNFHYNFEFAIHEFGHSFVRFLDKPENHQLMNSIAYMNNETLQNAMEDQGQDTSWANVFEEHLVRATEILTVEKMGDQKIAEQKRKEEIDDNHFIYIDAFVASLKKYDSERAKYPDLEKYFPVLIEDLKAAYEKMQPVATGK